MALLARLVLTAIAFVLLCILLFSIYIDYEIMWIGGLAISSGSITNTDVFTGIGPNTSCYGEKCENISDINNQPVVATLGKTPYSGIITSATESNDQITLVVKLDSPPSSYSYAKGDGISWGKHNNN